MLWVCMYVKCNSKFSWYAEYQNECVISSGNDELSSVCTPLFLDNILWIDRNCDSFVGFILLRNHSSDKLIILSWLDSPCLILDSRYSILVRIEARIATRKRLSTYIWVVCTLIEQEYNQPIWDSACFLEFELHLQWELYETYLPVFTVTWKITA